MMKLLIQDTVNYDEIIGDKYNGDIIIKSEELKIPSFTSKFNVFTKIKETINFKAKQ